MIQLLSVTKNGVIAESLAMMIANCCDGVAQQNAFAKAGTIAKLAKLLASSFAKTREAALDALSALCRENETLGKEVAHALVEGKSSVVQVLLQFVKDARPHTRLLACTCLTNLHKTGSLAAAAAVSSNNNHSHHHLDSTNSSSAFNNANNSSSTNNSVIATPNIPQYILPTLVKLLQEKGAVRVRAPLVLAYLVSDSESLQKAASDSDAVGKLASMLIASSAIPTANVTDIAGNGPESSLNSKSLANFQDQMKEVT